MIRTFQKGWLMVSSVLALLLAAQTGWAEKKYAPGELIVKYKETVSSAAQAFAAGQTAQAPGYAVSSLRQRFGLKASHRLFQELDRVPGGIRSRADLLAFERRKGRQVSGAARFPQNLDAIPNLHNIYVLQLADASQDMERLAREVSQDPAVEYAHPNYLLELTAVPNDPSYGTQWAHPMMSSENGWNLTTGNPSVVIAVVDTGIGMNHPDLAANLWTNPGESGANSINAVDDDSNGFVDDVHGWNFADASAIGNTSAFVAEDYALARNNPQDTYGHGSLVAGVASAVGNNGVGVAGTAWSCKIMPLKTALTQRPPEPGWTLLSPIYMLSTWVASGVTYAANNGASVINLSMIDNNWPSAIKDAIDTAYAQGVVVVAGAGNYLESVPLYPAAYSKVIGVAATDQLNQRAIWGVPQPPLYQGSGTQYGSWVSVAAPGSDILSTSITGYATASGTSMSTAFVSGLAALIRSLHPAFTNAEVMKVIYSTTDPVTSDKYIGTGRINVYRALQMSAVPIAEINTPTSEQTLATTTAIQGSAGGANFSSYTLQYGLRFYPGSWTTIASSSSPVTDGTLATWDLSSVTDNMPYTLRLSVSDASGNVSISEKIVYVQKNVQPGWPKSMGDFFYGNTNGDCIATGDLDQDNDLELAVIAKRSLGGPNQTFDLYAYHHDGSLVLGWPLTSLDRYMGSPTIADLTNSGEKQIIAGGHTWGTPNSTNHLRVLSPNGSPLPGWPLTTVSPRQITPQTPSVGDVDNDGNLEIVMPSQHDSMTPQHAVIQVLRFDGTPLPGWPKDFDLNYPAATGSFDDQASHACLADLNEDGTLDIICGLGYYQSNRLCAWDYQGNTLTGWPVILGNEYTAKPVAGDINHDGHMEVVAVGGNTLYAYSASGATVSGWPVALASSLGYPILADLDGDGTLEIIVYCATHQIYAFHSNGTLVSGWPVSVATTFVGGERPTPIAVDLDDDGHPEIVYAAGEDANIYAWHGNGTAVSGWPKVTPDVNVLAPVAADFNHDGNLEMAIAYGNHTLNLWALNTPYTATTSAWASAWYNSNHTAAYVADFSAPTVSVTAPGSGATVLGNVNCSAAASDNIGVAGVRFQVDGVYVGQAITSAPYAIVWNSFSVANGAHAITAVAWDRAGNRTTSLPVNVTVNNPVDDTPPAISLASPLPGATISGTINVSATASDAAGPVVSGMDRVQFILDGSNFGSPDTTPPYLFSWNSASVSDGAHSYAARAWDAAGNSTLSASVSFTVANGGPAATRTPTPAATPTVTPTPTPIPIVGVGEVKVLGSAGNRGVINPSRGESAKIYFRGSGTGVFDLRIFNLAGEQVFTDSLSGVSEGAFEWKAPQAASGIYTAVVQGPGVKARKKIAVIK